MRIALLLSCIALPLAGGAFLTTNGPAHASPPPNGAQIYMRCAACHTAKGSGVPRAYPPLGADFRRLAVNDKGRRYLMLAVIRGLMGPITVDGKPYRGMMPAQSGLDDASVAAVLNHVGTVIATTGPKFRPFTEAEAKAARASASGLSSADVAKLHESSGGK